jgi:malonyl-CoA/methylmalonyl-CoA synthetase
MAAGEIEVIRRASTFRSRTAVIAEGRVSAYGDLLEHSARLARVLLDGRADLAGDRVLLLVPPGAEFVAAQWAIWRAGGIAVPVTGTQAVPEWDYVLVDSGASAAVVHASYPAFGPLARERGLRVVDPGEGPAVGPDLPGVSRDRRALILYTSGTTSSPKGAVLTHANIEAEITCLIDAWGWSPDDRILHVLPLNHTHGLINVLACALWAGACCDMLPRADVERVWDRFGRGDLSLFMAVPTIYRRLVAAWDGADQPRRQVGGSTPPAADGVGVGGASSRSARAVAADYRARAARALRHDRDRHGHLQSAGR